MSFPGRLLALLTGGAAARALSGALDPTIEDVRQDAWRANPIRQLDVNTLANAIAQQIATEGGVAANADAIGYSGDKLTMAAAVATAAPATDELLRMLLRGRINSGQFQKGLRKHRIPDEWHAGLEELEFLRLSPADLANAEQQGFTTTIPIAQEAKEIGLTPERLQLLFELAGLPPGIETALEMWRRGFIDQATFAQIVREGHTKTKYTAALERLKSRVLSMQTYATLWVKGWITQAEAEAGGALTGFTPADVDLQYKSIGRPAAPVQIATANARGIPGPNGLTGEALMQLAVQQSDIRPEWGPLIYGATRYVYPSLFQLNRLVTGGEVTGAQALDWAAKDRYAPEVLAALAKAWGGAGTTGGKELTKAEALAEYEGGFLSESGLRTILTNLGESAAAVDMLVHLGDARLVKAQRDKGVTAIGKAYIGHAIDAAQAAVDLAAFGVSPQAAGLILQVWNIELNLGRHQLTVAQIQRAYRRNILTQAQALTELEARGYTPADAATLLAEVAPLPHP